MIGQPGSPAPCGGWSLYAAGGRAAFCYNLLAIDSYTVEAAG